MHLFLLLFACSGTSSDTAPVDTDTPATSDGGDSGVGDGDGDDGGDGGDGGAGGDGGDGGDSGKGGDSGDSGGEQGVLCDDEGDPRLMGLLEVGDSWARIRGVEPEGRAGREVDAADLDGDGVDEVLIGAARVNAEAGVAYVLSAVEGESTVEDAVLVLAGGEPMLEVGSALAGGDLDGDGIGELVAGAPGALGGGAILLVSFDAPDAVSEIVGGERSSLGEVLMVADLDADGTSELYAADGEAGASPGVALHTGAGSTEDAAAVWVTGSEVVTAISPAGDSNGDGLAELLIAAEGFEGVGRVWFGEQGGGRLEDAVSIQGDSGVSSLGGTLAALGDTDEDGYDDVAVGTSTGCFLLSGPFTEDRMVFQSTAWVRGGAATHIGSSMGGGDLNNDGVGDLVCGAFNGDGDHGGEAYVFYGPVSGTVSSTDAQATIGGGGSIELLGYPLVVSPDASGDGCPDVVLGAYGWDGYLGAAYVMQGGLE